MRDLSQFITITEPLLTKRALTSILAATEGIEWRVPEQNYVRTCTTFPISAAVVGNYPAPPERLEQIKEADAALVTATLAGLRIYKELHPLNTRGDTGFDILRYQPGQSIGLHVDDLAPRILTMSILLNEDFTGGEFRFWQDDTATFSVPAGCAIIFPPTFMYPHEILPIQSGTRYSMITWFV